MEAIIGLALFILLVYIIRTIINAISAFVTQNHETIVFFISLPVQIGFYVLTFTVGIGVWLGVGHSIGNYSLSFAKNVKLEQIHS